MKLVATRYVAAITLITALFLLVFLIDAPIFALLLGSASSNNANGYSNSSSSSSNSLGKKSHSNVMTTNYASQYLGATVVRMHGLCQGAVLSDNSDKYMICPCGARRKEFVVQLIRDVEVRVVRISNTEHFSSGVRNFTLLGSRTYPTAEWIVLGAFEAEHRRGRQDIDVPPNRPVRFVKFQWATSHGAEPWCTMSSFRVYGIDVLESLSQYGLDDDDDNAATAAAAHGDAEVTTPSSRLDVPGREKVSHPDRMDVTSLTVWHNASDLMPRNYVHAAGLVHHMHTTCPLAVAGHPSDEADHCLPMTGILLLLCGPATRHADGRLSPASPTPAADEDASRPQEFGLLAQLVKQQRGLQRTLQEMSRRESEAAKELNRTQQLAQAWSAANQARLREISDQKEHVVRLERELALLRESLRLQQSEARTRDGSGYANALLLAALACGISIISVTVVLISSSSSSNSGGGGRWGGDAALGAASPISRYFSSPFSKAPREDVS